MEDRSLFQYVQDAVKKAIAEDETSLSYFSIDRAMEILQEMTTYARWNKKDLFDIVAKGYAAVIANALGYRVGVHGDGIYFLADTLHEFISSGLVLNAEDLMKAYKKKYDELSEAHEVRFKKHTVDGQMAYSDDGERIIEEMTLATLSKALKPKKKES